MGFTMEGSLMKYFKNLNIFLLTLGLWFLSPLMAPEIRANDDKLFLLKVPQSGPLENLGNNARRGAELALKVWGDTDQLKVVDEAHDHFDEISPQQVEAVIGYFQESALMGDAPNYLYAKAPVILPFLTTSQAASLGPNTFFRLMPTYKEQGQFMAMEILKKRKRPKHILIIKGPTKDMTDLVEALVKTLANPPQPAAKTQKGRKPPPIKPLSPKAQVVEVGIEAAMAPDSIPELSENQPDLVILAANIDAILTLAPFLAESKLAQVPLWGGAYLGFRELGAPLASLGLQLSLCLPPVNLASTQSKDIEEFKRQYVSTYQAHPTWISALAYDAMSMAIKASSDIGPDGGTILDRLAGEHHTLGTYKLFPGGEGTFPLTFMEINKNTLGFLP